MVLGSSTHSFEIMLSAFITGLAIGGYWIKKRIDNLENPVLFAAGVQILMGLFALSTIILYNYSFEIMSFFMSALEETEQGYTLFSLASHSIALLIMLPTTICAGMTLPLFTFILLNKGHGEKSIGQIYSSNTLGAIIGVIFAVFVGMPVLTLKGSILTAAFIDIAIGIILIKSSSIILKKRFPAYAAALVSITVIITALSIEFNTKLMASGVFRFGDVEMNSRSEILFHRDGKTASVSVAVWDNKTISISTNGKSDAAITINQELPPSSDESTVTLLAALPLSIYPDAKNLANIGIGSGLTAHVALTSASVNRIDTIEIEKAMITGAKYFGAKTEKIFNDPRSRVHIDDARTFFSTHQTKYDIIISEPSNPWVSGVSSLFTQEFYEVIRSHLNKNGLLVQWIHIYEFNFNLLVSVLKAIAAKFPYYSIYFADDGNLILVASPEKQVASLDESIFNSAEMKQHLSTIHINNIEDLRFRFLGDQSIFVPFINHFDVPANSDYYPFLDLNASKARYMKENVSDILNVRLSMVPILDILYENPGYRTHNLSPTQYYPSQAAMNAYKIYEYFSEKIFDRELITAIASLNFLQAAANNCDQEYSHIVWIDSLYFLISRTVSYLTHEQLENMITAITPKCNMATISDSHMNWINLFRAFNERNLNNMISASSNLLSTNSYSNVVQKKFLLTSLLTGLIKIGENEKAARLWKEEMMDIFIADGDLPLEIQILLAHVHIQN